MRSTSAPVAVANHDVDDDNDALGPIDAETHAKYEEIKRGDLHIKDLANALDTSHGVGAQLPLTAAVMEMMQALKADGLGTADHSALA